MQLESHKAVEFLIAEETLAGGKRQQAKVLLRVAKTRPYALLAAVPEHLLLAGKDVADITGVWV